MAYPCNQFASQCPESSKEVRQNVRNTGAMFPVMNKVSVNGKDTADIYKFIKKSSKVDKITWNFAKFLIDDLGLVDKAYDPKT